MIEFGERTSALAMQAVRGGWHELETDRAGPGARYRYVLPNGMRVPDPASRHQPLDVHGPSEVIDPDSYTWRCRQWAGRSWHEAVIYELHIGAFTSQGTFQAAIAKLDHLAALGVTAIEVMPVADFPGLRNWGYDGAFPYAPDASYGHPDDFKALIDAAHERGLMVILDVVYNHFGPEGAYIHAIAPEFFTDRHSTPWGAAINFDGPQSSAVREFFIQNALYWIDEFKLDGLRFDAVHSIRDDSPKHILNEIAERVRAAVPRRPVHLILENEHNTVSLLTRESGAPVSFTAQWNDDVHHVLHVAATGERQGYYADYCGDTAMLARALAEGFAFQGEPMRYSGHNRGEPSAGLPPVCFIAFVQNHDQIGNRAFGDRLTASTPMQRLRAIAAVNLLLPQIPMLFMGEEWGTERPFPFFCDFGSELAGSVREGRRNEFARFPEFQDADARARIPDPVALETFESAKLDWAEAAQPPHQQWLDWYRRILSVRRHAIVPLLVRITRGATHEILGDRAVAVRWPMDGSAESLVLMANLGGQPVEVHETRGRVLWTEGDVAARTFQASAVRWSIEGP